VGKGPCANSKSQPAPLHERPIQNQKSTAPQTRHTKKKKTTRHKGHPRSSLSSRQTRLRETGTYNSTRHLDRNTTAGRKVSEEKSTNVSTESKEKENIQKPKVTNEKPVSEKGMKRFGEKKAIRFKQKTQPAEKKVSTQKKNKNWNLSRTESSKNQRGGQIEEIETDIQDLETKHDEEKGCGWSCWEGGKASKQRR